MARIIPKLNINKTPQVLENNSLIFAENIKVLKDGSIVNDDGISHINILPYLNEPYVKNVNNFKIVGYIPYNTEIFILTYNEPEKLSFIVKYNENNPINSKRITCNWKYNKGEIDGYVTVGLNSDILLTIIEYNTTVKVPIKTININESKDSDIESFYTQAPQIPISNISFNGFYNCVIPNGTYQFFIRYEIKKDFYTNWFLASKELHTATIHSVDTPQGSVQYIDTLEDSGNSFILGINHLIEVNGNNSSYFKSFQIGFILAHDDEIVARSWKNFNINTSEIYFDYDKDFIEEIDIEDLVSSTFDLYNVKNITSFKNKLYVSNYIQSDLDDKSLKEVSKNIKVEFGTNEPSQYTGYFFNNYPIIEKKIEIEGNDYTIFNKNSIGNVVKEYANIGSYHMCEEVEEQKSTETYLIATGDIYDIDVGEHNVPTYQKILFQLIKYMSDTLKTKVTPILYGKLNKLTINGNEKDIVNKDITLNISYNTTTGYEYGNTEFELNLDDTVSEQVRSYLDYYCIEKDRFTESDTEFKEISDFTFTYIDETEGGTTEALRIENLIDTSKYYVKINNKPIYLYTLDYTDPNDDKILAFEKLIRDSIDEENHLEVFYTLKTVDSEQGDGVIQTHHIEELIKIDTSYNDRCIQTLLPLKKYAFYIHYVTAKGEITNGYLINGDDEESASIIYPYNANDFGKDTEGKYRKNILYPKFSNIPEMQSIGNNYVACFFSILEYSNRVAMLKNGTIKGSYTYYDCIEIDTLLLNIKEEIQAYTYSNTVDLSNPISVGRYISSGEMLNNNADLFGASGKVVFDEIIDNTPDLMMVIKSKKNTESNSLVKCTPYIKLKLEETTSYEEFEQCNLLGFIINVTKPTNKEYERYYSGSDVFTKTTEADTYGKIISLKELGISEIKNANIAPYTIYSEFRMDMLNLVDDLKQHFKTESSSSSTSTSNETPRKRILFLSLESLTLSDCYELKSMYKSYTRKLFYQQNDYSITEYNNTIRVTDVLGDEAKSYIYRFTADKYYNIPTNKSIITSLKAISDKIFVHTEDSLFQFSGAQKLNTENGTAQISESDPFDSGITEMYGSEHGYAGLKSKHHLLVCYYGYFFFDKDAKSIYAFTGQQLELISEPIQRLMEKAPITDVLFANDFYNDRFFILIKYNDNTELNLSFNYKQKAFTAIHTFTFDKSFSTKTKCYFSIKDTSTRTLTTYKNMLYCVDKSILYYHNDLKITSKLFPSLDRVINPLTLDEANLSIVDVIYNDSYEQAKVLNAVSWIGYEIKTEYPVYEDIEKFLLAEPIHNDYGLAKIQVYSDECLSKLFDIENKSSYNISITDLDSSQYPTLSNGIWTYNNFRNILAKTTEYLIYTEKRKEKYEKAYPTSIISYIEENGVKYLTINNNKIINPLYTTNQSDANTLIYGKYFVVRFVFKPNIKFKLENVSFNIN